MVVSIRGEDFLFDARPAHKGISFHVVPSVSAAAMTVEARVTVAGL